jgi:hypothetical protein
MGSYVKKLVLSLLLNGRSAKAGNGTRNKAEQSTFWIERDFVLERDVDGKKLFEINITK